MRLPRRRWLLFGLAGVGLVILACWSVYVVPPLLRGEHFFRGRPTRYWSRLVSEFRQNGTVEHETIDELLEAVGLGEYVVTNPRVLEGEDALPVLRDLLHDDSDIVRDFALFGFTTVSKAKAVPLLATALTDRSTFVRADAVGVLGNLLQGDPEQEAWVPVCSTFTDESRMVRECGVSIVLAAHPHPASLLTEALRDPNPVVRRMLTMTVADVPDSPEERASFLREALKDSDQRVRMSAAQALKYIETAGPFWPGVKWEAKLAQ
jgi:HEAT repeats